jgi:hypothetical protein
VTFEEWQPAGRSFDLVVLAQSFHWLQPRLALENVGTILQPCGRLALLSNRATPNSFTRQALDEAYAGYLDSTQRPAIDAVHADRLPAIVEHHGFTIDRRHVTERLHYATNDWVNMVFTYSNALTLDPKPHAGLRSRLTQRIGVEEPAHRMTPSPSSAHRASDVHSQYLGGRPPQWRRPSCVC